MKKIVALLSIFVCSALSSYAQETAQATTPGKPGIPVVQFTCDWRAQNPPLYSIAIDSAGRATYHSQPTADPNGGSAPPPYSVEWTAGNETRAKIFEAIEKLDYLQGNFETHARVAQTGIKTITYKDLSHNTSITYNYSDNPSLQNLTRMFLSIQSTAEAGRQLAHDLRYDKLAIDADLKSLQEQQRSGNAIEFGSVEPILQRIANDPAMMRMSQQRARAMLQAAGLSLSPPPDGVGR